jgi:hypothetical protein
MDYCLTVKNRRYVAVEAKRAGIPFTFPLDKHQRSLSLSGTLVTDPMIKETIEQVRGYCDDESIRYAVATNGYSWIVFRALREDMPWRKGRAVIFPSLEFIHDNFTYFWNLLSYVGISSGNLDNEFGVAHRAPRQLHRVVSKLFNADLPLQRNHLNAQLQPLIRKIFEDIADQDALEILQSCYVHSESLRITTTDLNCVITDAIPAFLQKEGAEPIEQGRANAGRFGDAMFRALKSSQGELILLLGGIGSGKSTFLKRYQRTVGLDSLEKQALWYYVDLLATPIDPKNLEGFIWQSVIGETRKRYSHLNLESRDSLKTVFSDDLVTLKETSLSGLSPGDKDYERVLSRALRIWQNNLAEYVPRLMRLAQKKSGRIVVLFIDNVDQLSPEYQAQVFLLAQRVTRVLGSITVVALREESYYAASIQKTFTAYTNRKFHIASPHFRRLIQFRINFAIQLLTPSSGSGSILLASGIAIDKVAISDFLRIVEYSIFERNKNIARFIEAICFGNMRMALQMFTTFLTSGATDVNKMLAIYHRDGAYFVAFHEFVKSIMLGDRCYYKESESPIMNLFDCGSEKNSSHFTALRILNLLLAHRGESSREGQGYFEIARALSLFEDVFDNREDFIRTANRLIGKQLLETNTRSTETMDGASHIRVTSSGWYYVRFLVKSFSYLDLVLQDTPLSDSEVEDKLRDAVFKVNNLGDKEEEKAARMEVRFRRVSDYLDYFQKEEVSEFDTYGLGQLNSLIAEPLVPTIREQFNAEVQWISRRFIENRERFQEELVFEIPEDEKTIIPEDDIEPLEPPPTLPGL